MRVGHPSGNSQEVNNPKKAGRGSATSDAKKLEKDDSAGPAEVAGKRANADVKTEISPKSKEFAQAKAIANDAPDVRVDKIADLKKRIAEKSYKVDNAAIADKMVDEHLKMPDRD